MSDAQVEKRQCTATNRRGARCKKPPILGGFVCEMHGGGAPQVRQKANERLAALVVPAVARLGQLVRQRKNDGVALGAVREVLERSGVGVSDKAPPTVVTFTLNIDRPPQAGAPLLPVLTLKPANGNGNGNGSHG
jgi:hypothetical protein